MQVRTNFYCKINIVCNTCNVLSPLVTLECVSVGANVNAHDCFRMTALRHAVNGGNAEIVKALIQARADVDVADTKGVTPLIGKCHYISCNYTDTFGDVIKALLQLVVNIVCSCCSCVEFGHHRAAIKGRMWR